MVELSLPALAGKTVKYRDGSWELSGVVDVQGTGEAIEAEAEQVDDVRHRTARLRFGLADPPASLNPGNLGEYFERLEREEGRYRIVVRADGRTYRYDLDSMEYE